MAAIGLAFTGLVLGFVLLAYFSITALAHDLEQAGRDLARSYVHIHKTWPGGNALQQAIAALLSILEQVASLLNEAQTVLAPAAPPQGNESR